MSALEQASANLVYLIGIFTVVCGQFVLVLWVYRSLKLEVIRGTREIRKEQLLSERQIETAKQEGVLERVAK